MSQNNKTAVMLVSQTNPVGVDFFSFANGFLLFQYLCLEAGHVSENVLYDI